MEQSSVHLRDGQHNLLARLCLRGRSVLSGHPSTPALSWRTTGRSETAVSETAPCCQKVGILSPGVTGGAAVTQDIQFTGKKPEAQSDSCSEDRSETRFFPFPAPTSLLSLP